MSLSRRLSDAQKAQWNVDHVADGAPGARHTVQIAPGGGVDVTMHLADVGRRPATQAAEEALLGLLRDTFGEHAALVELIDLSQLRFTFGRHPSGEVTVWVKVPPPKGLPDRAAQEVARRFIDGICARGPRKQPDIRKGVPVDAGVEWADCQIGEGTDELFGQGAQVIVDRMSWYIDVGLPYFFRRLHAQGFATGSVAFNLGGDGTEGVQGSYDNQPHTVDLNTADQLEVYTGMVDRAIEKLVDLRIPEVTLRGVASNHDQQARGVGKNNITDDWDDRTFTVMRTLGRAYSKNADRYGNQVVVELPHDPNVSTYRTPLGLQAAHVHGHKPFGSIAGSVAAKMWKWWAGQVDSGLPGAGGADLLTVSHWHHAYELHQKGRHLLGNPSMNNGSQFLTDGNGTWSTPGLRVWVYDGERLWSEVLTAPQDVARERELLGRD